MLSIAVRPDSNTLIQREDSQLLITQQLPCEDRSGYYSHY